MRLWIEVEMADGADPDTAAVALFNLVMNADEEELPGVSVLTGLWMDGMTVKLLVLMVHINDDEAEGDEFDLVHECIQDAVDEIGLNAVRKIEIYAVSDQPPAEPAFQMPLETMVQPVTIAVCRKCRKPIEAGQFRFGSDEAGWEHMQGECLA